ncbi:MAG: DUF2270 domain-containing protein [Acidobacteriota bacterium]|nr:DUF2270 domain-containing protein [Acidobacteriota bacterium]MDH3784274.1 DUF2270 domain-containing protein [Acidobacteriota bacterium]
MDQRPPGDPTVEDSFESYPLTRQEYISVMVHFYRGEVHRSTSWRQRLDLTTNWAVVTMAGMLSFSFASAQNPHIVLLLSNLVILSFLLIEGRRYRYFEVYRARVRMLEENFLIPVITRQLESPMVTWREMVAMDLDLPKYKTTLLEAVGLRLRRNYFSIFLILLGAWVVKLTLHPDIAHSLSEILPRMAVGPIPAWIVAAGGGVFYGSLFMVTYLSRHIHGAEPEDEIAGIERNLEHWKL